MSYVLLWIENLAVSLLLMALVIAVTGRIRRRWLGGALSILVGVVVLIPYILLNIWIGVTKFRDSCDIGFYPFLALTIFYICGAIWLWIGGMVLKNGDLDASRAAAWPRGKLALAFGIALALHMMTFWNIDLEARQRAASFRSEAAAIAMSVIPPRVPDEENAALIYDQAAQSLIAAFEAEVASGQKSLDDNYGKWLATIDTPDFDPKDPQLVGYLKRQSGTMSLIMQAINKPYCYVDHVFEDPGMDIVILLPEVQSARELARLLQLDARAKAATGDLKSAFKDVNASFVIARHISSDPILPATLVSCAIGGLAFDTLQNIIASHTPTADDLDNITIDGVFSYQKLIQRAMRYEEACRLLSLSDAVNRTGPYIYIDQFDKLDTKFAPRGGLFNIFLLDNELKAYLWYSRKINQLTIDPYYVSKEAIRKLCNKPQEAPKALLVDMFVSFLEPCMTAGAHGDAQRRIVELVLAMCRYHAKNGKYPEKLEDLIPDFIAFVPIDPFDGKPIRLKSSKDKLVIYSVGPDGIDDGGALYDQTTRKGDIIFELPDKRD